TLLNLIAGIDKPDSGTLRVNGVDIAGLSEGELADWRASHVGFIFQFYNLLPVADEPTGDLDRASAEDVLRLMDRLNAELGKTIIMVTHDPHSASRARIM